MYFKVDEVNFFHQINGISMKLVLKVIVLRILVNLKGKPIYQNFH